MLQWGGTEGRLPGDRMLILKTSLSSDWSLHRLHELEFASNSRISHGAVNTFPGLVHTARQAMGVLGVPKSP